VNCDRTGHGLDTTWSPGPCLFPIQRANSSHHCQSDKPAYAEAPAASPLVIHNLDGITIRSPWFGSIEYMFEEQSAKRPCSFQGCDKPMVAKGYCPGHYKQWRKGKPLRPLRPFYSKEGPFGKEGTCRFCDLPQVKSGEWEPCLEVRRTGGWCAGHAAQYYEKRPLAPLRKRRTGCDYPSCEKPHHCRGFCAGHYRQLQTGRPLRPLNQRKGWFKSSVGYVYIWDPDHPNASKHGYVAEHTRVMSQLLGRALLPWEEVHHRNRRRDDNHPENLELWARGKQPPGARVSDLLEEAWRIIHLYGSVGIPESNEQLRGFTDIRLGPRPSRHSHEKSPDAEFH
jgi:hypothetical protein